MRTERYEDQRELTTGIRQYLNGVRQRRGFSAERCIQAKSILINQYFRSHQLSSATIGISGGIDSAVTLGLLVRAARENGSPIRRITPLLLPFSIDQGVSNQNFATSRGAQVVRAYGLDPLIIDLAAGFNGIRSAFTSPEQGDAWADGQLAAYLRTPALYYATALNTQHGFPGIVCGTTNRDEGAYLGFFGKASDGMVDLQIISDLHKSEVYSLAKVLGVPEIAIETPPTGDVYDGRTHLDMIGAPYDFVELYLSLLCSGENPADTLDAISMQQFNLLGERIENMHRYNRHKYLGGNPSVHLDLYERCVPGGWERETFCENRKTRSLVGEFSLNSDALMVFEDRPATECAAAPLPGCNEEGATIQNLLAPAEQATLVVALERADQIPVGINGMTKDYQPGRDQIGSYRATLYSEELAQIIWKRLEPVLPKIRCFDEYSQTDSNGHAVWRAVGINPSLRFIKYLKGGTLVPHYDAGYDYGDGRRHTLMSLVIYLTDGEENCGGRTRFILDTQRNLPMSERDYGDWARAATESEILHTIQPQSGTALVFDHRMLHDAEGWQGEKPRIIIRTDIVFERCGEQLPVRSDQTTDLPSPPRPLQRTLERARADKFFKHTCESYSYSEVIEGGYFDDGTTDSVDATQDQALITTALHKVSARFARWSTLPGEIEKTPLVLLTTGGFCPIHQGHLAMMASAKERLESEGYSVLGGFFAPDHSSYISQKCGAGGLSTAERLHCLDLATEESDWLAIDPWPALYNQRALNYTDIILRLEAYLARHIRGLTPIRVAYVCGGDNAYFARAFIGRGTCVVVNRAGDGEKKEVILQEMREKNLGRIYIVDAELPHPGASREIRAGVLDHLPEQVRPYWLTRHIPAQGPVRIYLRDEGSWATEIWKTGREKVELERLRREFLAGIRLAFIKAFNSGASRSDFAFRTVSAEQQQIKLREFMRRRQATLISLDAVIPAGKNISISRCFELCDSRRRGDFVNRPGSPALSEQLGNLGAGKYIVCDDDIATGQTIRALAAALPPDTEIEEFVSLFSLVTNDLLNTAEMANQGAIIDIGDLRDFLLGSRDGGLTILLPDGSLARAPYLLPYVRNTRRMSIPIEEELEFSRTVWRLNLEFFSQLGKPITVGECSSDFQRLALYLGWGAQSEMQEIALWHLQKLEPQQSGSSFLERGTLNCWRKNSANVTVGTTSGKAPLPARRSFGAGGSALSFPR